MKQVFVRILSIVLLLVGGTYAFAGEMEIALDVPFMSVEENIGEAALQEEMEILFGNTVETEAIAADGEVISDKDNRVFNILVIGTDERHDYSDNARGDACMLLSLDHDSGVIKIASFERALGVPILDGVNKGQWDWLTHTFEYGGAELMVREIRENFKIDVQYYVRVNMRTLVDLIDKIGGIDIDLTRQEVDYINKGFGRETAGELGMIDNLVTVSEGTNHLNGATTLVYARCRKIDSDWRRIERHRKVLIAVLQNFMEMEPAERVETAISLLPYIKTNIEMPDFEKLIRYVVPIISGGTEQITIPVENSYGHKKGMGDRSMFSADFGLNSKVLNSFVYGSSDAAVQYMTVDSSVLSIGSRGERVVKLQQRLIEEGLLLDTADGIFGEKTANAVKLMQKKLGLEKTGIADTNFLEIIGLL